ncbi:NADPH-dependent FMN reductase [Winogradskyella immobilis]|uniref:NAD(P)H-dependent oxidoreductase n=1 Tax=Winogradskyella immobilis TaxID=2816852 RepID=A0ABS8EMM5_9FLAO|nr:NAD(P)H-dependent oxidoreductase [Winogradskyella immobilis]MCC1484181.1 NAD(P)H-dependent oxidoreductase [Winogradskyella immobilis]MCG0016273.1 NAD(P)H-dependent oxidoreductase [Winogradskyella immobilis]
MKSIIAFAGSNSKTSINKQLATYTASFLNDVEVEVLDLNDFNLPMYGIDYENDQGIPDNANTFLNHIKSSDGIVLSLAEHNGAYTVAFKNIFDWMSRIDKEVFQKKPMLLMATSPGGRGGKTVLELAKNTFPHLGGHIVSTYSLPSFYSNFLDNKIIDKDLAAELEKAVNKLQVEL